MKIKINENAAANYIARCYRGANPRCGMIHRPEWAEMLEKVQGQWLEVETKILFENQFNTAPIPGVSEIGMRIMIEDVSEIVDDVRPGRVFDRYTNKNYSTDDIPAECLTEERKQYLYSFYVDEESTRKCGRNIVRLSKMYK